MKTFERVAASVGRGMFLSICQAGTLKALAKPVLKELGACYRSRKRL